MHVQDEGCMCDKPRAAVADDEGNLVCPACGVITGMQEPIESCTVRDSEGADISTNTPTPWEAAGSFVNNTGRDVVGKKIQNLSWQRRASHCGQTAAASRRIAIARHVERAAGSMGIPPNITARAVDIYRRLEGTDAGGRGLSWTTVAATMLYAACREQDLPHMITDISSILDVRRKIVAKYYRKIQDTIADMKEAAACDDNDADNDADNDNDKRGAASGKASESGSQAASGRRGRQGHTRPPPLNTANPLPDSHIPLICSRIESAGGPPVKEHVRRKAYALLGHISEVERAGKRPRVIAAGAVYTACASYKTDHTQAMICRAADISEIALRYTISNFFPAGGK